MEDEKQGTIPEAGSPEPSSDDSGTVSDPGRRCRQTSEGSLFGIPEMALLFAVCLGLAVAHLVTAVRSQEGSERSLIESTFTQAPKR